MQQLYSMTGYGKATGQVGSRTATVEIKSLNSKQLDLNLRMSACFRAGEMDFRRLIGENLIRGRIEINVSEDKNAPTQTNAINHDLFRRYYMELKSLCNELNISSECLLEVIMRIPDVLNTPDNEPNEEEWEQLKTLTLRAIGLFNDFRRKEGLVLGHDLRQRIDMIERHLDSIEQIAPERLAQVRQKLLRDMAEWVSNEAIDHNRFEQELLYYIEKLDINEEVVRLRGHLRYFLLEMAAAGHDKGKKLGFISQEIGREINTIGSKANYAQMQIIVVQMKDELEKIKEQLMNVI